MTISVISNAQVYGIRMRSVAAALPVNVQNAQIQLGFDAVKKAKELSSGPYGSPKTLRALGHPYAIRAPRPIGAKYPAMVNINTGRFRMGWYFTVRQNPALKGGGQALTVTLRNGSSEAKYFDGQPHGFMIARPILQEIIKELGDEPAMKVIKAYDAAILAGMSAGGGGVTGAITARGSLPDGAGALLASFAAGAGFGYATGSAIGRFGRS